MSTLTTKICLECGIEFSGPYWYMKDRKYCSTKCSGIQYKKRTGAKHHRYNKQTITCDYCNKEIKRIPSHIAPDKHNFCSMSCRSSWVTENTGVLVSCDNCGTIYKLDKYNYNRVKHHFCSKECCNVWKRQSKLFTGKNNPSWRGGYSNKYGYDWKQQRLLRLNIDNYTCQVCFTTKELTGRELSVHHIKSFRESKSNNIFNLISLCHRCHKIVEHNGLEYARSLNLPMYIQVKNRKKNNA